MKTLQVTTSKLEFNTRGVGKTEQRAGNSSSLSSDNHPFQVTFNYVFVIEVFENSWQELGDKFHNSFYTAVMSVRVSA